MDSLERELTEDTQKDYRSNSLFRVTLRSIFRQRSAIIGGTILIILVLVAIFAPFIAPYDPEEVLIGKEDITKRSPPCIHILGCPEDQPQHILGVDGNVRDEFSRVIFGTRVSLFIGFTTVGFAIIVGTLLGALAGYVGGWVDNVIMRFMDVLLAIVSIPRYARVIRGSVLSIREQEFVSASQALGGGANHILFRRILPNAIPPLIVQGTLGIAAAILEAAALSFLGLGAQPPTPEWGTMLGSERTQVFTAPHLVFYPGLAIMITVLSFNLLGDGLRDAIDPRLKE